MSNETTLAAMQNKNQQIAPANNVEVGLINSQGFEIMQRIAIMLSKSTLVPAPYRAVIEKKSGTGVILQENPSAISNCVIALNMAQRMGADPLMVMQNLYIVEGRPSWSSQWIIAAINKCGRFSPLRFEMKDLGEKEVEYTVSEWINRERVNKKLTTKIRNFECVAWALEKDTGEKLTSIAISMEMAVLEGWYSKNGSKWQTMPELMLRYRSASFFGKIYAPELLMGLPSAEETGDIIDVERITEGSFSVNLENLREQATTQAQPTNDAQIIDSETGEILTPAQPVAIAVKALGDHKIKSDWENWVEQFTALVADMNDEQSLVKLRKLNESPLKNLESINPPKFNFAMDAYNTRMAEIGAVKSAA